MSGGDKPSYPIVVLWVENCFPICAAGGVYLQSPIGVIAGISWGMCAEIAGATRHKSHPYVSIVAEYIAVTTETASSRVTEVNVQLIPQLSERHVNVVEIAAVNGTKMLLCLDF